MNLTIVKRRRHAAILVASAFAFGCAGAPPASSAAPDAFAERFAGPIARAHNAERWAEAQAVRTEFTVNFGGKVRLAGSLVFETRTFRARIETTEGVTAVFDGADAWVSPADAELPRARFHLLTWSYFLAAPFKLRDPGSRLDERGALLLDGRRYPAARLTFDAGVGDTPDDWYVVYRDPATDRLRALAYIVTYGAAVDDAEREPHCATYDGFRYVDGAWVPSRLRIYNWRESEGPVGEPIGEVLFGDIAFVTPAPGAFDRPADARRGPLPAME